MWRYNLQSRTWKQFGETDGVGDDAAYALACDRLGRVWVGTQRRGVAVWNGAHWHTYDRTNALLGSRVWAIAQSPLKDGDVWIATEAGLTRYSLAKQTWTHVTTLDGLPSNAVSALAFDRRGTLYVGLQTDGIAIARAGDNYRAWRHVPGPAREANFTTAPTSTQAGAGLPSGLVNCLLASRDGRAVYCGTPHGLAWSRDGGATWRFRRSDNGDMSDNRRGPHLVAKRAGRTENVYQPGDSEYITALAEDGDGVVWAAHRQIGIDKWTLGDTAWFRDRLWPGEWFNGYWDNYVTALLPVGKTMFVAGYSGGVQALPVRDAKPVPAGALVPARPIPPALPRPAPPPTKAQLDLLTAQVRRASAQSSVAAPLSVTALDDDWTTRGDWLGRYGTYWACLSALCSPYNYVWGAGEETVNYAPTLDPRFEGGRDSVRNWVHWLYTNDARSLELPPTYLHSRVVKGLTTWERNRRQSEWDDHGEQYPLQDDGPSLRVTLQVPRGDFYLSVYEVNKDGHNHPQTVVEPGTTEPGMQGYNRYRDYRVSVRAHDPKATLTDTRGFYDQPELAKSRVTQFWGGVWKRFLVHTDAPTPLTIQITRNGSYNTLCTGVMLDRIEENPAPYFQTTAQWSRAEAARAEKRQALRAGTASANTSLPEAAEQLFTALENARLVSPEWWAANSRRFYTPLLRWYTIPGSGRRADDLLLARRAVLARRAACCRHLGLYAPMKAYQKQRGLMTARQIEKALRWDGVSDVDRDYDLVTAYKRGLTKPQTKTASARQK